MQGAGITMHKEIMKLALLFVFLCFVLTSFADSYDRKDFNYRSYKPDTAIGFYASET